jgi:hypothetical protein
VFEGDCVSIHGDGWSFGVVRLILGDRALIIDHVLLGLPSARGVVPDQGGRFVVLASLLDVSPGTARLRAESDSGVSASAELVVGERWRMRSEDRAWDSPYWRARDFFARRFGHIGFVPAGTRTAQIRSIVDLRARAREDGGLEPTDGQASATGGPHGGS